MTTDLMVFDKIDNPLQFINEFGDAMAESGMFGTTKKAAGRVLAMACLCERKNPIEISRVYNVIDGRLSMRADAMYAEFRRVGGRVKWLTEGDDDIEARAVFSFEGEDTTIWYKMAEADKAKRNKPGSGYDKDPGAQLRARLLSRGIRMLCPEINAGYYVPEEIEHLGLPDDEKTATADKALARKVELKKLAEGFEPSVAEPDAVVIEVDVAEKTVEEEEPPFEAEEKRETKSSVAEKLEYTPRQLEAQQQSGHGLIELDQRQQIAGLCEQLGSTIEAFAESYKIKHGQEWTTMSNESADAIIAALEAKSNAK
jgi:hypothetical protein